MTLVRTQYVWRDLPTYLVSRYSTQLKEECIVPTLFIFVSHKIKDYNIMSPFIISLSRYFYAFVDSLLSLSLSFFLSFSVDHYMWEMDNYKMPWWCTYKMWRQQQPLRWSPVWSDLAKLPHFSQNLQVLGIFCGKFNYYMAKFWRIMYAIGQIFVDVNGQKINK